MEGTDKHENIQNLKVKLRELFQLDRGDLDFGLYRIMTLKSVEVNEFLDQRLLPQVTETLGDIAKSDESAFRGELDKITSTLKAAGVKNIEEADRVKELKAQIKAAQRDQQTEADTYNHLYNFFSRYYDEGDFMSLRRYKTAGKDAYSIPYNGEEVKLHWANSDQYYIKTTENYSSYMFTISDGNRKRRVCFEIAAADNEQDNIKESNGKQRLFVLAQDFIKLSANELIVRFDHRPLTEGEKKKHPQNGIKRQHAINQATAQRISTRIKKDKEGWLALIAAPCPTEADESRTLFGKHLTTYTAKNSFDYFIHKDLGGFLRRELDNYLKSEVISIDNLELSDDPSVFIRSLAQIKTIKKVGSKIIDFLAQLEDFQKQLWLKKKLVLETQYCVTLDKVPESLYVEVAKNKAQRNEWVKLFAIDELKGDLAATAYSNPLKPNLLKENPYLVLDTRHFNQTFKDKLLAALSDAGPIEAQLNGLLVHGENFQALNLLQERYKEQVKCIYIDPPYNTDASSILYKNGYKDSSWMSLMEDRLMLSKTMLGSDGIVCVAIDDEEVLALRTILTNHLNTELGIVTVRSNPAGRKTKGRFAPAHEYALFYGKTENVTPGFLEKTEEQKRNYPQEDEKGRFTWGNFVRSGTNDRRQDRPKQHYPIFVNDKNDIRIPRMEWNDDIREWVIQESPLDNETLVHPMKKIGDALVEGNWHRGHQRVASATDEYRVRHDKGNKISIQFKVYMDEQALPKTWWDRSEYQSASGTMLLTKILGDKNFDFPKSIDLVQDCLICAINGRIDANVLDYFAGSGTTGHAVINLNREDGGERKYILVELGHHFETVLLPRMKKVTYSKEWKDGKPQGREGISQLFKYVRLESYEDTLDNLIVKPRKDLLEAEEKDKLIDDYLLRYTLGEETATSASLLGQDFIDPFNYTLSVVRDGVRRDAPADLVETFNFLLGLRLATRRQIESVLTITGINAKGENCLILWRNIEKMNAPKLDKWFGKHRKTFANDLNLVYVNGDHTLNALKKSADKWEATTTEPVFRALMFGDGD